MKFCLLNPCKWLALLAISAIYFVHDKSSVTAYSRESMANIVGLLDLSLLPLSRCYTENRAFSGVKTHLPSLFLFFKGCQASVSLLTMQKRILLSANNGQSEVLKDSGRSFI